VARKKRGPEEPQGWFERLVALLTSLGPVLGGIAGILAAVGVILGFVLTRDHGHSTATTRPPTSATATPSPPPSPPSQPPAPPSGKTFAELEGSLGAKTFRNPGSAAEGPKVPPNAHVRVSCKLYAPVFPSVSPEGYWYRIASKAWNNRYYAVANTFMNGGTRSGPGVRYVDKTVPNC